jgi:hypothetical protein
MTINDKTIVTPIRVTVEGRAWRLFMAEYTNPDGKFSLTFHALSSEHAAAIVEEIKESLKLTGEVDCTFTEDDVP